MYNIVNQLNTVSEYEYIQIVATWFYNVEDNFRCAEKIGEIEKNRESEIRVKEFMTQQGCNSNSVLSGCVEKPSSTVRYRFDNLCFYNCFCNYIDHSTNYLLDLFLHFEKNLLPFPGTITEQPAKILEVFNIFSYLKSEKMKEEQKKAKKAQKNKR